MTLHPNGGGGGGGAESNGNGLRVSFSLLDLLKFSLMLGPLIAVITYAVTLRQDLRTTVLRVSAAEQIEQQHYTELKTVTDEFVRTKLTYCLNMKADSTSRAPDAHC